MKVQLVPAQFASPRSSFGAVHSAFRTSRKKIISVSFRALQPCAIGRPIKSSSCLTVCTGSLRKPREILWGYIRASSNIIFGRVVVFKEQVRKSPRAFASVAARTQRIPRQDDVHGLGGALAFIFAFFAACEDWMQPIECVTFGAPRFGNTQFFRAFRRLEEEGRVSLLRVVNGGDPVTSAPDRLNCGCSVFFQSTVYRHVGMELRFSASRTMIGRTMAFYCPFLHKSYFRQWFDEVVKGFLRFLRKLCMLVFVRLLCCCCSAHCGLSMHSCKTYMDRIGRESEDLVKHRLREIYQKLRR
jgi:hypothetical protein